MKLTQFALAAMLAAGVASLPAWAQTAPQPGCVDNCFKNRWVYFGGNFTVKETYDKLLEVIVRARLAGYNGIALSGGGNGSYVNMLSGNVPANFYSNMKAVVKAARDNGIELIPVGGGPEVPAQYKPELVEALPVVDTPFIVSGSTAVAEGKSIVSDPGFEAANDLAWRLLDTGSATVPASAFFDAVGRNGSKRSVKLTQANTVTKLARLYRELKDLKPHRAYRMSFWVKTQHYDAPLMIQILAPTGSAPMYRNGSASLGWGSVNGVWNKEGNSLAKDQDWKEYTLDFNTGNYSSLRLYFGTWANGETVDGAAWIDDVDIREIGLAQVVRRNEKSLPVVVKSASTGRVFEESSDYVLGSEALTLPTHSNISNGERLLVSAYQSGVNITARWGTAATACHPDFFSVQKEYYGKLNTLFETVPNAPAKYFLYYDENRLLNWDPSCTTSSAGAYLARMISTHRATLLKSYPKLDLYVWHDMFDPRANAIDSYWAVNGSLKESWLGLDKDPAFPEDKHMVVVNWTDTSEADRTASLKFFHGRGMGQMVAGYYDDPSLEKMRKWLAGLDAAEAGGVRNVDGFMYTTWNGVKGYEDLEKVADYIKKNSKRWPQ
ncbi:carbohydrate binding domain-containing protein [Oxalobacteraceae bacterium]|nr:carbohydrate binding domain-containing protein [Oxalobacteraceae bacterium]